MTTVANPKVIITAEDKTARAFSSVRRSLTGMEGAAAGVKNAFNSIGVGISVAAIVTAFGRAGLAAISYGDEVQKAAARTGTSASQFAKLADAAKLADVDMATLSKGLRTLNVKLSEASTGAKGPTETFAALGLSVNRLRQLKPDQQLELIADAIAGLKDPAEKARAGTELFGKAWEALAPLLIEGSKALKEARAEIDRLGGALTDEQIAKLADADSAIKQLSQSWSNFARVLTSEVAPALSQALDSLSGGATRSTELQRQIDLVKGLRDKSITGGGLIIGQKDIKTGYYRDAGLAQIQADLERRQRIVSGALPPGGRARTRVMESPGYTDTTKPPKGPKDTWAPSEIYIRESLRRITTESDKYAEINREVTASVNADLQDLTNSYRDWSATGTAELKKLSEEGNKSFQSMKIFAEEAARGMQDALATFLFDPFAEGLDGMAKGFVDMLRKMVAELAAQEILRSFFTWAGGALGGTTGAFVAALGTRASGGPVTAGGAYLVGERGPEMFIPKSSGNIIPNGAMGGSVVVNYSIDARGADAERIMSIMPGLLKQTEDRTVSRVIDLQRRGRLA